MRVLVTGHKGYIGTVLVPMLVDAGHDVVGLDSDLYRRCTFGVWTCPVRGIDKDVRDADARDLEGFDAVLHLAGLSNDPLGSFNPASMVDSKAGATCAFAPNPVPWSMMEASTFCLSSSIMSLAEMRATEEGVNAMFSTQPDTAA